MVIWNWYRVLKIYSLHMYHCPVWLRKGGLRYWNTLYIEMLLRVVIMNHHLCLSQFQFAAEAMTNRPCYSNTNPEVKRRQVEAFIEQVEVLLQLRAPSGVVLNRNMVDLFVSWTIKKHQHNLYQQCWNSTTCKNVNAVWSKCRCLMEGKYTSTKPSCQ